LSSELLADRYEVQQKLVEGPIFTVWSAKDRITVKDVSLRILNPPYNLEVPFHTALQAAIADVQSIKHPAIERITSFETDDGRTFLVGEAVRGMSLTERIRKLAPFSVPVAVGTAITLCEALASLHRAGVIHGDVGSHNVTVLPEGTAILQQSAVWTAYSASRMAGPAVLPLMAPYLAPEISTGELPTTSSDVYAVGIILYQLLTGQYPFFADQPVAMALKHVNDRIPSVRAANQNIPVALDEVIRKAMAKSKADRYVTAVELLSDLRMIQDAIRFGRNLAWPLVAPAIPDQQSPVDSIFADEPLAATTMKSERQRKRDDYVEGDVPGWIKGVFVFLLAIVVMMVGTWVVQNLSKPKDVLVPDLNRLTISNAEQAIKPLKLKLKVKAQELNETVPADVILDMDPMPGEKLREGGTIYVTVSGGSRFVEVPDLRGMNADEAKILLDSLGLKLDDRIAQKSSKDVEEGMIMNQVPEPRTRVERRTSIRATTSSGRRGPDKPAGDSNQKYLYTIRIELSDITEEVLMRVDMTDSRGTKTISEERRQPGDLVELTAEGYGDQAIFKIYYDGEPITQIVKSAKEPEEEQP
jgi:serine/threonine-protein kinase